jgi:hypothetical protein
MGERKQLRHERVGGEFRSRMNEDSQRITPG